MTEPQDNSYVLDDETQKLIEIALNCMVTLADAQMLEQAREDLLVCADELARVFNIPHVDVVESHHENEIIYKPRGGVFGDEPDTAQE
mgnify:FL=1|jgi:hypothetical protein